MSEPALRRMTLAEFLDWDDGTDTSYELIDGVPRAMAPADRAHAALAGALAVAIGRRLAPPCRVLSEAGIVAESGANFFEADLAVTCAPIMRGGPETPSPVLLVEVLSPSTEAHDRGLKGAEYRRIESCQEVLFVSSDARRVELWRREGETWRIFDLIGDATVSLTSLDVAFGLAEIYEGIVF